MARPNGDTVFLSHLPQPLSGLGRALLRRVRQEFPKGRLRYCPKSDIFVETPDNFWAVQIQPRAEALEITLRGLPKDFSNPRGFDLTERRTSYTSFKVITECVIDPAMDLLRQASYHEGRTRLELW